MIQKEDNYEIGDSWPTTLDWTWAISLKKYKYENAQVKSDQLLF